MWFISKVIQKNQSAERPCLTDGAYYMSLQQLGVSNLKRPPDFQQCFASI